MLIPTASTNAFIQLIYSCFSRDQVLTNSVAPSSVYKAYTTLPFLDCSDEDLTLETSAFQSLYGGQFTFIINSVDKQNFRVSLPQPRSTTVSSETNSLYP